ncbi:hypothetical protein ACFV1U_20630 [Streptomyces microflavus]|uniref:hypothetical protein n=1 Tax=Streptomyces microflavus TaxID=1919 RepID=UPI00368E5D4D
MDDEIWRKPFRLFLSHMEDSERLTSLTYRGINGVVALLDIGEILKEGQDGEDSERSARSLQLKDLSNSEITSDFPLLHAHSIMGEWGAMECLIEDLVEAWVVFRPETLERTHFARVRVPLATILGMSEVDRSRLLVSEVQRDLKVDLTSGATKFEKLLEAAGLGGPVDPRVREALYEAQNVRNVWAHRGGIADKRLVEACPQLGFREGEKVSIGKEGLQRYRDALWIYSATVLNRCQKILGLKPVYFDTHNFKGALGVSPEVDNSS